MASPIKIMVINSSSAFEEFAPHGVCCWKKGRNNTHLEKLLAHATMPTKTVATCEDKCLADGRCQFFSYSRVFASCVLCSGCLLSQEGSGVTYVSWRKRDARVITTEAPKRSLVVVAALGALSPTYTNARSLLFTHFRGGWDCTVFAYARFGRRGLEADGLNQSKQATLTQHEAAKDIASRCQVVECRDCSIGRIWRLLNPAALAAYEYLLLLQDDVLLGGVPLAGVHEGVPSGAPVSFNASTMLATARNHRLDVASPAVIGASWASVMAPDQCSCDRNQLADWYAASRAHPQQPDGGGPRRENQVPPDDSCAGASCQMAAAVQIAALNDGCVRDMPFLESYALLFTPEAWRCYHDLMSLLPPEQTDELGGWGYDVCYPVHCPHLARQSLLLSHLAVHAPRRTEGTESRLGLVGRRSRRRLSQEDGTATVTSPLKWCAPTAPTAPTITPTTPAAAAAAQAAAACRRRRAFEQLEDAVRARHGRECVATGPHARARRPQKTCLVAAMPEASLARR